MSFGPIDLLFNMVVMLFWFRLWNRDPRMAALNPYLSGLVTFSQPVLDLFRALFRSWTGRNAALTTWLILILFRALALPSVNPNGIQEAWALRVGFEAITPITCANRGLILFIVFSVLSFAIFLFQVWGFALLFLKGYRRGQPTDRATEFLYAIARPFSDVRPQLRPWILLGYGTAVVAMMNLTARGWVPELPGSVMDAALLSLRCAVAAVAGAVDLLLVLQSLLIVLIIGSWVVVFTEVEALMIICKEWLDFLLGPFRRFPIHIGPVDLTPIIAFFALGIVHWLVNGWVLAGLYIYLRNAGI